MMRIKMNGFVAVILLLFVISPCYECRAFTSRIPSRIFLKPIPMKQQQKVEKEIKPQASVLSCLTAGAQSTLAKMRCLHWNKEATIRRAASTASQCCSRLISSPVKQQITKENKTEVASSAPSSSTVAALAMMRSLPWRKAITIGGFLTTAGLLTSVALVAFQRRQIDHSMSEGRADAMVDEMPFTSEAILPIHTFDRLDAILNNTDLYLQGNMSDSTSVVLVFDSNDSQTPDRSMQARQQQENNLNLIKAEVAKARSSGEKVLYIPGNNQADSLNWVGDDWSVLEGESNGRHHQISMALRTKYGIIGDDMRVLLLRPGDEQVVAENVLDLMRFVPEYTPWGGRQNKQQPSLSLHSLVTEGAPVLGPSGSNYTVSLGNRTAAYKAVQQKAVESSGSETEFIFVSLDQSESEFDQFRKEIPFPALPFNDRRRALLQVGMNMRSVPSLVLVSNTSVTSSSGVTDVLNDPNAENYPWSRSVVNLGSGFSIEKMRHTAVLIAFIEDCSSAKKASVKSALLALEAELQSTPDSFPQTSRSNILISYIEKSGELAKLLRKLVQIPPARSSESDAITVGQPQFAMLDLATDNIAANDMLLQEQTPHNSLVGGDVSFQSNNLQESLKIFINRYRTYQLNTFPLQSPVASPSTGGEDNAIDATSEEEGTEEQADVE